MQSVSDHDPIGVRTGKEPLTYVIPNSTDVDCARLSKVLGPIRKLPATPFMRTVGTDLDTLPPGSQLGALRFWGVLLM